MAADLFETYAVTAVAVMLLARAFPTSELWLFPLAIGGVDPRLGDRDVLCPYRT